ncbi:Hypothetical predicted protein [Podarcis lilfordi]|uniref:Uncharacterized protein n=1 Tax=Podarcis lilfordi TaxID=74358 RepID=A0AA35LF21_9SAUR|nr:Hypothetical predicted protein [Podarcis lilfordi]
MADLGERLRWRKTLEPIPKGIQQSPPTRGKKDRGDLAIKGIGIPNPQKENPLRKKYKSPKTQLGQGGRQPAFIDRTHKSTSVASAENGEQLQAKMELLSGAERTVEERQHRQRLSRLNPAVR